MYYNTDRRGYEPCTLLLDTRTIVENCAGYQKMDLAQSREGIDEPFDVTSDPKMEVADLWQMRQNLGEKMEKVSSNLSRHIREEKRLNEVLTKGGQ